MKMKSSTRIVLYGLSSFMDMVAGTLLFVVPVRAAQLGASYSLTGGLGVAWGLGAAMMVLIGNAASLMELSLVGPATQAPVRPPVPTREQLAGARA